MPEILNITNDTGIPVADAPLFTDWANNLDPQYIVKEITIQSVDRFGGTVRFIKLIADIEDAQGRKIPGVVFLRGDSVAILPVLVCEGQEFTILTTQTRVPTTFFDFQEIPAGCLDGGNFAGTAIREMNEETGLDLNEFERIELTSQPLFLSPGACDEQMMFYAARKEVTRAFLEDLRGKVTGCEDEGERIVLSVVPLDALATSNDAKTVLAWALYKSRA